jgi:hypothetical protein
VKDRLLTLALAVGAFAAFYALLIPKPPPPAERSTRPLSIEVGPNGYLAMQRWLEREQVKTHSLRERYQALAEVSSAVPTGNLLISTTPHVYPIRSNETDGLWSWISAGNTLLVVAGLSDTPEWSMGEGVDSEFLAHMKTMTGLSFTQVPPEAPAETKDEAAAEEESEEESDDESEEDSPDSTRLDAFTAQTRLEEPQRSQFSPNGSHPLLDRVQSVLAVSEYPSAQWRASSEDALLLELARERETGVPALWLVPHGNGQIIVSAYGSILTNKVLGEADNARLLANIVRWSLGPQGTVFFDDAHQGLVSFYDPDKFFGDSRLHRSLWWLVALWLVFVLGARRLRPAASTWNPLDVTSFVRATGGFMARVLKPSTAADQLFANFFNELRQRLGLAPDGTPVWQWLEAHATIPTSDLTRMRALHQKATQRGRVNLRELHNLLVRVRAQLT